MQHLVKEKGKKKRSDDEILQGIMSKMDMGKKPEKAMTMNPKEEKQSSMKIPTVLMEKVSMRMNPDIAKGDDVLLDFDKNKLKRWQEAMKKDSELPAWLKKMLNMFKKK